MTAGYTVKEVARLVALSESQVRGYVRAELVQASRGARNEYRFDFASVVMLRAAKHLQQARIPKARIRRALNQLRTELGGERALTGLEIGVEGDRIVVHDGSTRWSPESGQIHFNFGVDRLAQEIAPLARRRAREAQATKDYTADQWYDVGCDLETPAPDEARAAYRRALELDPSHADAHINLGRLLHELGELGAAEHHYRLAMKNAPTDPTPPYNLGVLLEEAHRLKEARVAYEYALARDPSFGDACFNLAALCEELHDRPAALRYLNRYRRLT